MAIMQGDDRALNPLRIIVTLLCKSGMFAGCISVVLFQKDVSFL
jgi:hypothetical protein